MGPAGAEAKHGIMCLLKIGTSNRFKRNEVAEVITALVHRTIVSWELLSEALAHHLDVLEDLLIDEPHADQLFHCLMAGLLAKCGTSFNKTILHPLSKSPEFCWSLLLGSMKHVKATYGSEEAEKAFVQLLEAMQALKPMPPD